WSFGASVQQRGVRTFRLAGAGLRTILDFLHHGEAGTALLSQAAPEGQTAGIGVTAEKIAVRLGDEILVGNAREYTGLQAFQRRKKVLAPPRVVGLGPG